MLKRIAERWLNSTSVLHADAVFVKDLSNIYLKAVNSHRFNQSDLDTRSWYHGTAASTIQCLLNNYPAKSRGISSDT